MKYILKLNYRNFVRKPVTNLINLIGLVVSLAMVLILSVYSYSELTSDNYHKNEMYQSEIQFQRTFSLFAGCAIVICCMGILAMSLFVCQRRIKEIGIRKVNGATIPELMTC
jgi:putative ABC transport system permease protein